MTSHKEETRVTEVGVGVLPSIQGLKLAGDQSGLLGNLDATLDLFLIVAVPGKRTIAHVQPLMMQQ